MSKSASTRSITAPLVKLVIFILVTSFLILILANTIRGNSGSNGDEYSAIFTDATQSEKGDEVRIAGVAVGRVTKVELYDNDKAKVSFTLNGRDSLPVNTHATLKLRNLIGQRYVALSPEPGKPEGDRLEPGSTIPIEQTTPAINLTALFDGFRPLFTTLQPEDVNKLATSLVKVLQGEGGTIQQLVGDIGSLTNTLADRDKVIGEVIDNLTAVLDTINNREDQFNQLAITTSALVDGLAQDKAAIGDSLDSLADLTSVSENVVQNTRPEVTDSITALNEVATGLNSSKGSLEDVLTTLPVTTEKLQRAGSFGSWFQFYLCGADIMAGPGSASGVAPPLVNQPLYTNVAPRCTTEGIKAAQAKGGGH